MLPIKKAYQLLFVMNIVGEKQQRPHIVGRHIALATNMNSDDNACPMGAMALEKRIDSGAIAFIVE